MNVRGLSKLQKRILTLALKNGGRIASRDVLINVYKFPPLVDTRIVHNGQLVFDRRAIGLRRYQSVSVATCKSFNRLHERGLAERVYGVEQGIRLTEEGREVAETLNK